MDFIALTSHEDTYMVSHVKNYQQGSPEKVTLYPVEFDTQEQAIAFARAMAATFGVKAYTIRKES